MSTVSPTPRVATKGELTRRQVLDAAIALFGRDGHRATSVADIARAAAVGGSVPYAYFANKEALFQAAADEDAAAVIHQAVSGVLEQPGLPDWQDTLLAGLIGAVDRHPLARRLLAGLEPEVTARVLDLPALAELRKVCADRLAADQLAGNVRTDIDPMLVSNGIVSIVMSLLMSVVQLGVEATAPFTPSVGAVFDAALGRTDDARQA